LTTTTSAAMPKTIPAVTTLSTHERPRSRAMASHRGPVTHTLQDPEGNEFCLS
jgi:hypothetical protein